MANKGIVLAKIDTATDPQTNPSTSQQRMFLHDTEGWGYLDDSNVFTPFGTGAGSSDELYIDTLPLPLGSYPCSLGGIFQRFLSFVSKRNTQDDAFIDSHLARVFKKDATGNYTSSDESFSTLTELETYVNSNFANNGANFSETGYVLFYEKISSSIPTLTNASARNKTFSSLARGRYKNHNQTASACSYYDSTMATIFNLLHGTAFTALDFGNTNARATFWLPRNYKLYNKPYIHSQAWKTHINFIGGANGQRYQATSGALASQVTDIYWEVSGCYIATFDSSGSLDTAYNFNSQSERSNFARDLVQKKRSYVSFYGVASGANRAVIVKPVGIDQINMEAFDENVYDLQLVSRGKTDNAIVEKTITGYDEDTGSNRIRVDISEWMIDTTNMTKRGLQSRGLPDFYFRLKDKTTGEVGKLSDFYISTINKSKCKSGQTTLGFVVKNDKK